jgi:hypothetical protein
MLDDLRNSVNSELSEEIPAEESNNEIAPKKSRGPILGMTAPQRFIIAVFIFLMVAVLGIFILILFQKVYPPI